MSARDLLPPLGEEPADAREAWRTSPVDEIVYRLGLIGSPVPGLPERLPIGQVEVEFIVGPVRAQWTELRQRFGLPVVFDKRMSRVEVGQGETITLLSLRTTSIPASFETAFASWRTEALAAAGLLAAVLDERVVGRELFEDAVLFSGGRFVGGADMQGDVRTYLPFEVNVSDRAALEQLRDVSLAEASTVARAARLYRRAALEGPSADTYTLLWVAAECFSDKRSPSPKEIKAALRASGLNPDGLPISVGRLAGIRSDVVHRGVEHSKELRTAFYEMEAVVRCLIRREAGIVGGWWSAADNPAAFASPFDAAVAAMLGPGTTEWHDELPPLEEPVSLRIPRKVSNALNDVRVDVDEAFADFAQPIAIVVVDALEWQEPNASLSVRLGLPEDTPPGVRVSTSAETLWISEELLAEAKDPATPGGLINLVWELHAMVGIALAQQAGLVGTADAVALGQAVASFAQFRRNVVYGDFDADPLRLPAGSTPADVGKLAGWAAAGSQRAREAISHLNDEGRSLAEKLIAVIDETRPGAPVHLLALADREHPKFPDDSGA